MWYTRKYIPICESSCFNTAPLDEISNSSLNMDWQQTYLDPLLSFGKFSNRTIINLSNEKQKPSVIWKKIWCVNQSLANNRQHHPVKLPTCTPHQPLHHTDLYITPTCTHTNLYTTPTSTLHQPVHHFLLYNTLKRYWQFAKN